jgi:hypothetical protein
LPPSYYMNALRLHSVGFALKNAAIKPAAFKLLGLAAVASSLTACYVVPINHPSYPPTHSTNHPIPAPILVAPPAPITIAARLYPTNDQANPYGVLIASVTNDLNGRGQFSVNIGGESFVGEATRISNSRSGTANGAGNRGSYIRCSYQMNSATQGTGRCEMSNGAIFSMHVGS